MAELPAMPLWTDAYLAATWPLTTVEHGAYMLLLMAAWEAGGSLPNDDCNLARYARLSNRRWERVKPAVMQFFVVDGETVSSPALSEWVRRDRASKERPAIPRAVMCAVANRDGNCCVYCGTTDGPFHFDHRLPWSRGGQSTVDNLCVACARCNLAKSDLTDEEFLA